MSEKQEKVLLTREQFLEKFGYIKYSDLTIDEKSKVMQVGIARIEEYKEYGQEKKCISVFLKSLLFKFEIGSSDVKRNIIKLNQSEFDYLNYYKANKNDKTFKVYYRIFKLKSKDGKDIFRFEIIFEDDGFDVISRYGYFDKGQVMMLRKLIALGHVNVVEVKEFEPEVKEESSEENNNDNKNQK